MASELQSVLNEIKLEKDSKLLPENIRKGVNILGVQGSVESGVDTSDATATSDDIINPKTAYINGEKVIGNIVPTYMYDPTAIVSDTRTTDLTNTGNYPMGVTYDRDIIVDYDGTNIRVYKLNTATNSYDKVHSYTRADLGISDSIIKQIKITKTEVVEGFYRIGFMVLTSISDGAATQTIVTNFLKKSTGELNVIPTGYSKLNTSAQRISWGSGGFAFAENNPNYVSTICREHYGDSQGWSRLYTYYLGTDTVTLHNSKTDNGIPRWEHIIDIEYCGNDNYIRTTSSLASGNGNLLIAVSDYKYLFTRSGRIAVNKNGDKCIIPSGENTILYSMVNNGSSITLSELHTFNVTLNGNYYWGDNDIIYNAVNTNTLKIFNLDTINGNMTLQGTFTANLNVVGLGGTPTFYDFNVKGFTCKSTGGLISLYSYKYNTEGTLVGLTKNGVIYKDTSDATATANSIAEGKIAYANGEKIVGTIKEIGGSIYSADTVWVDNDLNTLMMQDDSRSYDAVIRSNGVLGIGANLDVVAEVIDLTPDKIVAGNTILGIEGTAKVGSGGVKQFSTINEMQADETATEGDLAVVYGEEIKNATVDSQFQIVKCPQTVVLPEAITDGIELRFNAVDGGMFDCWGEFNSSRFSMDCYTDIGSIRIEYESSDGTIYTRTDGGEEIVDFGVKIEYAYPEMWNNAIGYFMQIQQTFFNGLFKYETRKSEEHLTVVYNPIVDTKNTRASFANSEIMPINELDIVLSKYCTDKGLTQAYFFFEKISETQFKAYIDSFSYSYAYPSKMAFYDNKWYVVPQNGKSSTTMTTVLFDLQTKIYTEETITLSGLINNWYYLDEDKSNSKFVFCDWYNKIEQKSATTTVYYLSSATQSGWQGVNIEIPQPEITKYYTAPMQLDATAEHVFKTEFFGKNGVEEGSLQNITNIDKETFRAKLKIRNSLNNFSFTEGTSLSGCFSGYAEKYLPNMDTTNVTSLQSTFYNCVNLVDVPLFNTLNLTSIYKAFESCPNLSDESLNNILAMCTNATKITSNKTLQLVGLTEEQATRCTTLSNYEAFVAAGWTTGY